MPSRSRGSRSRRRSSAAASSAWGSRSAATGPCAYPRGVPVTSRGRSTSWRRWPASTWSACRPRSRYAASSTAASPERSASGAASRTRSSGSASPRHTTGACCQTILFPGRSGCRSRYRASRRCCGRRSPTASSPRPSGTSTRATRTSRSSSSPTCISPAGKSAGRALARRLHRRGRLFSSQGHHGGPVRGVARQRVVRARLLPAVPGGRSEDRRRRVLELADDRLPGAWGLFELDVDALVERVPDLLVYEDVITYPALKQELAFAVAEDGHRRRARRRRPCRRRPRAARDDGLRRLPRRAGGRASRSPSACRSSRRSGRSRTKTQRR